MTTIGIKISSEAYRILKSIADSRGISLIEAIDEMTKSWDKQHFFDQFNTAYAALKEDPDTWRELQEERAVWDITLADNLEDEDGEARA